MKINFCIATKALYCDIVALDVQEKWIVLQRRRLEDWKLYCNTAYCIARLCSWLGRKCIVGGVRLYCSIERKLYCKTTKERKLYCKTTRGCWKCVAIQFFVF